VSDLSGWRNSPLPSLAAAVASWNVVTSAGTFHDLARDPINKDFYVKITADAPAGRRPDFTLLPAGGGEHGQRAFSAVLQNQAFHALVNDTNLPLKTRCRIRQCSQERAGDFLNIIPYTEDLVLANSDFLPQWWHNFGLPQRSLCGGACCRESCTTRAPKTFPNWNDEEREDFESGAHSLSCGAGAEASRGPNSNPRKRRHNGMNTNPVGALYQLAGWSFSDREAALHFDNGKRVDGVATTMFDAGKPEAVDTTVVCPACRSYVTAQAAADAEYCTRKAEREKFDKHGSIEGHTYVTAAFTTYGGWGREFMTKRVRPHWKAQLKKEKSEGGNGWETQRAKRLFFQRAAVILARGNAHMIKQAMSGLTRIGRMGA